MIFRIPWGILFDRKGFKKTMTLALTLMGVFGLARGFAVDYVSLLITHFFLGTGLSGVIPAIPRLVSCWFPREKIGVGTGICLAGFPVGDFIALSFTPFLLAVVGGWRQIFLLPTLVGQLRDVSGTFLLSMLVLAIVSEGMLVLGLLLPETGRKGKTIAPQD